MAILLAALCLFGCSAPLAAPSVVESEAYVVDVSVAVTGTPVPILLAVTPSPEPPASPTPSPEPPASPTPSPVPTAAPTAEPTATPKITATPKPTATPKATAKPTATPKPTAKPTATPKATSKPTATPKPTAKPTAVPPATSVPTEAPLNTPPMAEITPTPEPTQEPTATPKPTEVPQPTSEPDETPSPTEKPSFEVSGKYSYEDLELAARVAYFETGTNDGYKAVLSVIYHRCHSKKFGGKETSIPTEVYRSSQFSVVRKSKFETTVAPEKIIRYADEVFNQGKTTVPETVLFFRAASLGLEWGTKVYYDTIGGNAYFHAG